MNQNIRFCRSADGVKLAYAVSGEGPPLVMSATWLSHLEHQWQSLAWQPWLDAFSRDHKLLRYDSRGCGLSDRDAGDFSFETWVRDFECVIEAASFRRFDLLATCWGGPVAIEYAARHPERVNRLILYGTYGRGRLARSDRPKEADKARVLLDLTQLGWGRENHAFLQVWASHFQPGGTLEHLRSWCDQQSAATSAETAVRLLRIGWNSDVTDAARKIRCPVLMLHAERDAVVPIDEGRLLASLIPDCRFVPLDSSFVICKTYGAGIECGLHFDIGPGGARGTLRSFSRMIGRRTNGGHSHSAGIDGGAWQVGTFSNLTLEYNHGPSSWTHSFIITHENSKRQMVTIFGGKWRA